jgi:hypothetical protein
VKYRVIVRDSSEGETYTIQTKRNCLGPWEDWCKCESLEQADKVVKTKSKGTVVKEIWNYDKAGNRINDFCW